RALRQMPGELLVDQLFQCGLIMVDEFPRLELPGSSGDDLLHDRELVSGGGLVGDRREELVGGADLLRKAQGVDEQTLAVWTDRDRPQRKLEEAGPVRSGCSGHRRSPRSSNQRSGRRPVPLRNCKGQDAFPKIGCITRSPGSMPSREAVPPFNSMTARTGPAAA